MASMMFLILDGGTKGGISFFNGERMAGIIFVRIGGYYLRGSISCLDMDTLKMSYYV